MPRILFLTIVSLVPILSFSQFGNLNNHQGPFHIDAKNDTSSSTSGTIDDIIITEEGKMGIGKIDPETKLEIKSNTDGKSGLRLTQITSNSEPYYKESGLLGVDRDGNVVVFGRINITPPPCVPTYIQAYGDNATTNITVTNNTNAILPKVTNDPRSNESYNLSTGAFKLKKGETYQLEASIFNSYNGNTNSSFSYEWYLTSNGTTLPFQTTPISSVVQNTANGYISMQPYLISMYTPTTDAYVAVRFKDIRGASNQTYSPKYSYISIRQINPCQDTELTSSNP